MLGAIGEPNDPDDMFAVRDVAEFNSAIIGKGSTEENYLRPRMEILVDLGLIKRKLTGTKPRTGFMWEVTEVTERLAQDWSTLAVAQNRIPLYLDREFFDSMSRVARRNGQRIHSLEEKLLWFTRAYQGIGREFGFTPGRTCALLACLLAYEAGFIVEISELFEAVFEAGRTDWGNYLHFSGGSRFDQEFLIRIDAEVAPLLAKSVHSGN